MGSQIGHGFVQVGQPLKKAYLEVAQPNAALSPLALDTYQYTIQFLEMIQARRSTL
jgi:hypothetical protein